MTGDDDDIAAALPRPPFPAPARREAAIAEAMRRFDGGVEQAPAAGRPGEPRRIWSGRFDRPQAGALAGALLVALIALPLAWSSLPDPPSAASGDAPAETLDRGTVAAPPATAAEDLSSADMALDPAEPMPGDVPSARAARTDEAVSRSAEEAAAAADSAARDDLGSAAAASRARQPGRAPPAEAEADGSEVVVTGARIRRPNLESALPITSVGGETFARSGKAARRGDWNACTVEDPIRDLSACRRQVASVARGASGKASAPLADGLSSAWKGDLQSAIGAFDRAIELAPRSASAHLNRGLARRRLGDTDRALADLNRAAALAPGSARIYYHRSLLLRERGDSRRARADERRAVELDPNYAELVRAQRRGAR